jgi:heat shock protein HtpX
MWNSIKTVILLGILSGLLLFLGAVMGGSSGVTCAFIFAVLMNGLAYFFSDRMVLAMYRAQPLDQNQYDYVYSIVRELTGRMHIPMPKLWLINSPMANAFATGRNPQHASIAVTTGILSVLERHELRGVLAHEIAHIYNRDILITTIATTLATAIGYCAHMIQHFAFWGSIHDRRRGGNPIALFIIALLMPFAALLLQLALSRSREYGADETGAYMSEDPLALASALQKLERHIPEAHLDAEDRAHTATAPLFIIQPFLGEGMLNLFSTHPSTKSRIARLRAMYEKMVCW